MTGQPNAMQLIPAQNGGWIVTVQDSPYTAAHALGAYTNTADALVGLALLMAASPPVYSDPVSDLAAEDARLPSRRASLPRRGM